MATIPILDRELTQQASEKVASVAASGSQPVTIRELIDQQAAEKKDVPFLFGPETGQVHTFHDLRTRARQVAAALRREGLKPGDKVAFLLDNGLFAAELFLGAMYGGMVSVPLNVNAGVSQLVYMLDHSDADVVFVSEAYTSLLDEVLSQIGRAIRVKPAVLAQTAEQDPEPAVTRPEDTALLMYSSGSTGRPKAAIHTHAGILAAGRNSVAAHQLTAADRSLLVLPLYHINAECVTLVPTLLSGGSVVIPSRFSVSHFWDWIEEFGCTWSAVVPTIISQLLDWEDPRAGRREEAFRRLRFLRSSSAPLAPALQREFIEKFHLLLIQAMGSSEAGNVFSNPQPPMENKVGSPGLPWGFEAKIVDGNGAALPSGEPGEVLLRGPALMRGYYKEPEGTAAVLDSEGWLHTGDLAYRDNDGYFFVVGRSKELIIKGGVNIAPRQIDDVIEAHPAVLEAAAIGVPDHHLGEDVIAFVVLRGGARTDERELLAFCERRLGHFKTPARIHFASDLPKGPSGKVQRLRLREQVLAGEGPAAPAEAGAPKACRESQAQALSAADVREIVAKCWTAVLGIEQIDPDANFFALGGHSLLAVQCLSRLRDKIPVVLSLSDFFDHATIAKQTALVMPGLERGMGIPSAAGAERQCDGAGTPIAPRDRRAPCPLSPGQKRLWLTEQLNPGAPIFNESESVRLTGDLNVAALEEAMRTIVSRHEILRSTIQTIGEDPVAVVKDNWRPVLKRIDLSSLAPSIRDRELARLLVEEPRAPFHLESEPGIRLTLVCLGPREHVLILMMHHLVCDWASEGVFWRELSALYRAIGRNAGAALAPLALQYGDYAAWNTRQMAQASFTEELNYWEKNLGGAPGVLDLPADRPRPAVFSHRGARLRRRLDASLTASIRALSQRSQTTLFTIVAAGWNALLYRYSGKGDILLGIPISERERGELRDLIGFFLHTQVLRTEMSADTTFAELVNLVQKGTLGLFQNRAVPFEQVVARLGPKRNSSYTPLFQVMFIWRDREQMLSFIGMDGLQVESVLSESGVSKFDLTLMATDCGDEIELEMEYSTDLFDQARIERMFGHFAVLLNNAVSGPDGRLGDLRLLTDEERDEIGNRLNRTEVAWASPRTVDQLIADQTALTPDALAVTFENTHWTYRELEERANQLAAYLRTVGVGSGTVAGICVERSAAVVVGLLGILKSGAAYLPLDPAYPPERLALVIEDARPVMILTDDRTKEKLSAFAGLLTDVKPFLEIQPQKKWKRSFAETRSLDDLAYVLYTSGSTGKPKGVQIPHRAVANLLCSMQREPGFTADDTLLAVTTLSFDIAGLEMFLPLTAGGRVVIAGSEVLNDGSGLASLIAESRATVMQATPATWRMLLDSGWAGSPRLKILCGGEAWSSELASGLLPKCRSLWNMYGPTETTIWSAVAQIRPGKPVRIGRPIANTVFYVLDANEQLAPAGLPGELYIGGDGLALGYWNRPDLTAERFLPDPFRPGGRMFRTGDLVRRTPEGELEFLHRTDNQVKVRGYRIELGEVEATLERCPAVKQAVVVVRGDDPSTRSLAAYVVPSGAGPAPALPEIREALSRTLPSYMVPASITVAEKLPLTPNGKIDRNALARFVRETGAVADAGDSFYCSRLELQVAQIWEQVLGAPVPNHQDNFFDLGGHSLLAVRLISEVNRIFDTGLTVPAFLEYPTVAGMAALLRQNRAAIEKPMLIPLRSGRRPGTIFFLSAGVGLCRLGQALDNGAAVYAALVPFTITPDGAMLPGQTVAPALPEIASVYVDLIAGAMDGGPCVLVGHSFTGLLAFEIAHQLEARGLPVRMITFLDAWTGAASWRWKLRSFSFGRAWASLRRSISRLVQSRMPASVRQDCGGTYQSFDEMSGEVFQALVRRALKEYRLMPLNSRAVVFRARASHRAHLYAIDPSLGWKGLFTEGIDLVETPGDHSTMLLREHLPPLARQILNHLDEVMGGEEGVRAAGRERPQMVLT